MAERYESEEEKFLEIAHFYSLHKGEPQLASITSRSLGVSGKDLGKVKQMMDDGIIQFTEDGEPYFTIPLVQAKREIATNQSTTERADKAVLDVTLENISEEAQISTKQYLVVGKAVAQAIFHWGSQHGYTPQQLLKLKPHDLVLDAFAKRDKYDGLVKKIQNLESELEVYRQETDPVLRIKESCRLTVEFIKASSLAELAGFDIHHSGIVDHYQNLLNMYLRGT